MDSIAAPDKARKRVLPVVITAAVVAIVVFAGAYVWVGNERTAAAAASREEALLEVRDLLAATIQRSDRVARSANRTLSPLPVMTARQEGVLRRHRNAAHVARAREIGVRVPDQATLDSLIASGVFVLLEDSTDHWIVRSRRGTHVVPAMRDLLGILAERFQGRLADLGLPPYRIEVTSALRTTEGQNRLRRTNSNAAAGVSSHEFGTTVDLSYAAFAPPASVPTGVLLDDSLGFASHLERIADLALESVSARKSRELGAILAGVLEEVQEEGLALVIYERQQTVHHVTVARRELNDVQD